MGRDNSSSTTEPGLAKPGSSHAGADLIPCGDPMSELQRRLTVFNATTVNMSNMVGIGPFIAIALILKSLGGPQAYLAWLVGTVIAIADGLVVAELGAALPAAGGTYVFLREGFGPKRWGRLLAFLFVWQILFAGPLEIASGNIGLVQYLQVFWPGMSPIEMKFLAAGICVFLIFALYRRIGSIARIMAWLWGTMLVTTGWLDVELTGEADEIDRAVDGLRQKGCIVDPIELNVVE